jgi:hypothetical protein
VGTASHPPFSLDTIEHIDQVISVEIPDPTKGLHAERLYKIVTSMLIYRLCNANSPSALCYLRISDLRVTWAEVFCRSLVLIWKLRKSMV